MGVPDRGGIYSCPHPATRGHRSPSTPVSLTTTMADNQQQQQPQQQQPQQPQQQQQQQQQQQYDREPPPPYPGHPKHIFSNMPGFRQSYSGSDTSTDMSLSSTENLASWQRQEPQGEETTQISLPAPSVDDGHFNVHTRLQGLPQAAVDSFSGSVERLSSSPVYAPCSSSFSSSSGHRQTGSATSTSSGGEELSSSGGSGPLRQHLTVSWQTAHGLPPPQSGRYFHSQTPTYHHPHPYVNENWTLEEGGVSELCGQSSQVVTYVPFLPPPPEYPGRRDGGKVGQVRCQSDPVSSEDSVSGSLLQHRDSGLHPGHLGSRYASSDTIFSALRAGSSRVPGGPHGNADHVVNILNEENRRLQDELVQCYKKIAKLQKLEQEIQHVQEAYQSLVRSTEKRERLEAAIKNKLQEEVKKLQSQNEELKAQLQKAGSQRKPRSRSEGPLTQKEKENVASLKQLLNEKHTKVEQLESEIEQWEQKYSELQATQHRDTLDTYWSSCPSLVTKSSQEATQRLHEEAQSDKQKHSEKLSQSHRRITELEAKVNQLQNQLAEKEEVLRTHSHTIPPSAEGSSSHSTHPQHLSPSQTSDDSLQNACGQQPPPPQTQCKNEIQLWQV